MSDPLLAAIYAGLLGAILSGFVTWIVGARTRRHNYYSTLVKLMGDHNWNCLKEKVNAGLPVTFADEATATVCYQHINFLLYAQLHKDLIAKDGTLEGWKRWASAIVDGAGHSGNEKYGYAYRDILIHGDVYPTDFISWLKKDLQFSADRFPVPHVQQPIKTED